MNKVLTWFIRCWIAIAILVNVIAVAGIFLAAHSFSAGFSRLSESYRPMNIFNWLAELVLVSPAIGAFAWLQRRQRRQDAELINKAMASRRPPPS
jgi:hypothetical protein